MVIKKTVKKARKVYPNKHKNDKIGSIKIISDVRKSSSSYGNYVVFVEEIVILKGGYPKWVEQPKSFWTKAYAEAYIKKHT